MEERKKRQYRRTCDFCGHKATQDDARNPVIWSQDPYGQDINGDETFYWICLDCNNGRCMDI